MKEELKNPVWRALTEAQQEYAITYNGVAFFNADVCNFGAFIDKNNTIKALDSYGALTDDFYIVGEQPEFSDVFFLKKEVPCFQMVLKDLKEPLYKEEIVLLDSSYIEEVYNLIWLVMPGYYKRKTFTLGSYYGIIKEGKLVAITGERLQSDIFIEVSAVVTHPDYTGRGYAKQLVSYPTEEILKKNKLPILHVAKSNSKAISLYEKLGYEILQTVIWRNFIAKK